MARHTETQRLKWALIISSLYFLAELIAGFLTNSLALLSDAGHMLSDIGALGLSIFAFRVAKRPAYPALRLSSNRNPRGVVQRLTLADCRCHLTSAQRLFDPPA
jgi:cobalt-zinc-cadmium efflux system protein